MVTAHIKLDISEELQQLGTIVLAWPYLLVLHSATQPALGCVSLSLAAPLLGFASRSCEISDQR